jgi:hypothetical protein
MIYAQFFQPSATDRTKLIEACGDRSVVILDARFCRTAHRSWAQEECASRGYKAWQLMKGPRFSDSRPISDVVEI